MSFNVVELVKNEISGEMLGQMGTLLGNDSSKVEAGLASAIPGLLNGLTQRASVPGGADSLFGAVNDQDEGLLGNIGSMLGGDQGNTLLQGGVKALTGLLGTSGLGTLGTVLSGVSGLSSGGSKSLLGLVAPIIIGVLKRKVLGGGLNASSLMSLLTDQKSNVDSAMPAGLNQAISSSSLLSDFNNNSSGAATRPADYSANTTPTASGTSGWKKFLPVLAIGLLAIGAFKYFTGGDAVDQVKESGTNAVSSVTDAANIDVDGLGKNFTGLFGETTGALEGITDVDSAKSSIPALTGLADKFGGLTGTMDKVPDAAKGPLAGIVSTGLETLTPLLEKIRAIPGVGAVIDPIVQPMIETLQNLAQ